MTIPQDQKAAALLPCQSEKDDGCPFCGQKPCAIWGQGLRCITKDCPIYDIPMREKQWRTRASILSPDTVTLKRGDLQLIQAILENALHEVREDGVCKRAIIEDVLPILEGAIGKGE
jgi:hypothetical protein